MRRTGGGLIYRVATASPSLFYFTSRFLPFTLKQILAEKISRAIANDDLSIPVNQELEGGIEKGGGIPSVYMDADEGSYTGKTIILRRDVDLKELGVRSEDPLKASREFSQWLEEEGLRKAEEMEVKGMEGFNPPRSMRTLLHEHCHWRLMRSTSSATLLDATSWRVELDQAVLGEQIYMRTGIPRRLNEENIGWLREHREEVEDSLVSMLQVREISGVLRDLVIHHFLLSVYYPCLLSPPVETVTWALVEPEFLRNEEFYLRLYFSGLPTESQRIAREFLDLSVDFLRGGGSRTSLIQASNTALDFPMREAQELGAIGRINPFNLEPNITSGHHLILERFRRALRGQRVERESREEKNFRRVIGYASQAGKVISSSLISRNPDAALFGMYEVMKRYSGPALERPKVVANVFIPGKGRFQFLSDPFSPFTMREYELKEDHPLRSKPSGLSIYRPGDLAGDSIQAITAVLSLLLALQRGSGAERIGDAMLNRDPVGYKVFLDALARMSRGEEYYPTWDSLGERFQLYSALIRGEPSSYYKLLVLWLRLTADLGPSVRLLIQEEGMAA